MFLHRSFQCVTNWKWCVWSYFYEWGISLSYIWCDRDM